MDTRLVRGEFAAGFHGVAAAVEIGVVVSNEMQYGGLKSSLALQRMNAESRMYVKLLLLALGQGWGRDVRTKDIRGQLLKFQWIKLGRLSQHQRQCARRERMLAEGRIAGPVLAQPMKRVEFASVLVTMVISWIASEAC